MVAYVQNISESLSIGEQRRGSSNCVISDMLIGQADITAAQFELMLNSGSAVGYGDFRNFISGDHEYQKAIFKSGVNATSASAPRIQSLSVDVDVPDIFDRGNATTIAGGVMTVTTNRVFYAVSDVLATCKSGTVVASPRVSNIRTVAGVTQFDVELIDTTGARVAGLVSWALHGY